jgi:hypothetical protein
MDRFVQRQNIAKLSNLLAVELDPNQRSILMRSLIEEEDQFGFGLEQLRAAEKHLADCQHHIVVLRGLIDFLSKDGSDVSREKVLLDALTDLEAKFDAYRERILDRISLKLS